MDQGPAPLSIEFVLNATDPDGDLLQWTFDADGDGLPETSGNGTTVAHQEPYTYVDPGNYTAVFTVQDAAQATTVLFAVQAA